MKYFKGKYSEGSGGRVRETFFHSRRKIFMLRKKVVDDLSPTDSTSLGSFSNFCCSLKHWMSLCQISLLFPGLLLTLGVVETPVCCPQAGNLQGPYGVGEAGARVVSWELLVSYISKQLLFHGDYSWKQEWSKCVPSSWKPCFLYLEDVQPVLTRAKRRRASLAELCLILELCTSVNVLMPPIPIRMVPWSLKTVVQGTNTFTS